MQNLLLMVPLLWLELMQRSSAAQKSTLPSVGAISFSVNDGEGIFGVEEAIQNIRVEAKSLADAKKTQRSDVTKAGTSGKHDDEGRSPAPVWDTESGGENKLHRSSSSSSSSSPPVVHCELAVDVANSLVCHDASGSQAAPPMTESDASAFQMLRSDSISISEQPLIQGVANSSTEGSPVKLSASASGTYMHSELSQSGSTASTADLSHPPVTSTSSSGRPQRPPPPPATAVAAVTRRHLQSVGGKPVAATDINAILDSFSTPPKGQTARQAKQRNTPVMTVPGVALESRKASDAVSTDLPLPPPLPPRQHQESEESSSAPTIDHEVDAAESLSKRRQELDEDVCTTELTSSEVWDEKPTTCSQRTPDPQKLYSPDQPLPSSCDSSKPSDSEHSKRRRKAIPTHWLPLGVGVLLLLLTVLYYLSSFCLGLISGGLTTLAMVYLINRFLLPCRANDRCHISGDPLGQLCCSLHCPLSTAGEGQHQFWPIFAPALPPLGWQSSPPQLRDLPSPTIPVLLDEDPRSSASKGPLGKSLDFKLNQSDRPVFRGWMNEIDHYDALTHHVSRTHSVYVTLDGSQIRVQRPRRNIPRRSMWSEDLPPITSIKFRQQRIFDLIHSRVTLVPPGLVSKRLWSKKYPIAITIPNSSRKPLSSSVSVPSMLNATVAGATVIGDPGFPAHAQGSLESMHDVATPSETIHLFGRTCREKEAWYRRFRAASLGVPLVWTPQLALQKYLIGQKKPSTSPPHTRGDQQEDSFGNPCDREISAPPPDSANTASGTGPEASRLLSGPREPTYITYIRYMARFMPAASLLRSVQALRLNLNHISCEPEVVWINALLGRLLWDFLREVYWLQRVRDKLQAKLKKIHLPQFISDLRVVSIDLGSELPVIRRIGQPYLDAQGLWFELDIAYAGGFSVVLETSVNLLRWNQRLRDGSDQNLLTYDVASQPGLPNSGPATVEPQQSLRNSRRGAFCSEEEDSADSTTDSDSPIVSFDQPPRGSVNGGAAAGACDGGPVAIATPLSGSLSRGAGRGLGKPPANEDDSDKPTDGQTTIPVSPVKTSKSPLTLSSTLPSKRNLIRFANHIITSTYFQKAVDNKLVQRGMKFLSNTPIVLEAEVQLLSGTLLLNIPPPPSDRLWYGFRPTPQLRLKARPRVGEKAVTISRILEWIENRCVLEFQRLLVLPNMDDISIPLLLSDITDNN